MTGCECNNWKDAAMNKNSLVRESSGSWSIVACTRVFKECPGVKDNKKSLNIGPYYPGKLDQEH